MKVSELNGAELDYWVSQCNPLGRATGERHKLLQHSRGKTCYYVGGGSLRSIFAPSTKWDQGGPIIHNERILLSPYKPNWWRAVHIPSGDEDISKLYPGDLIQPMIAYEAETPLVAAMRCIVASKFGQEVPPQSKD